MKTSDHPGFKSTVPGRIGKFAGESEEEKSTESALFGDLGIYLDSEPCQYTHYGAGGKSCKDFTIINGFHFLLPLEGFRTRPNHVAHSKLDYVPFGQVNNLAETVTGVTQLTLASKSGRMTYSITLESR
jgi:hypothetical protein